MLHEFTLLAVVHVCVGGVKSMLLMSLVPAKCCVLVIKHHLPELLGPRLVRIRPQTKQRRRENRSLTHHRGDYVVLTAPNGLVQAVLLPLCPLL